MAERDGTRSGWSTKKQVKAERGLSQRRDGDAAWCPRLERQGALAAQRATAAHEATRILFAAWCVDWLAWAKLHHKGYATDLSRVTLLSRTFGSLRLDEITPAGVEASVEAAGHPTADHLQPLSDPAPGDALACRAARAPCPQSRRGHRAPQ